MMRERLSLQTSPNRRASRHKSWLKPQVKIQSAQGDADDLTLWGAALQ